MTRFKRICRLFAVCGACFASCGNFISAETSSTPESARPYGMGNAFSAVANDLNAILFNPAGLSTLRQIEVSGNASRTHSGVSPQTDLMGAAAVPLNYYKDSWTSGTAGFLLQTNGGSGQDSFTNLSMSLAGAPYDILPERMRIISSSLKIPERLHAGGTLRMRRVNHGITGGTGYGFGIDLGFLYQFDESVKALKDGWSVSLVFQEMNMKSIGGGSTIRLGTSWRHQRYTLALDMVTQKGITRFLPGAEASFFKRLLLLRAGTGIVPGRSRQAVIGIGTLLPPIELDLAYGFPISDFHQENDRAIVSLTYRFGSPLLGQFIENSSREDSAKAEMGLANLEYKRATLKAEVNEHKALYEKIDLDLRKTREKTEVAIKDLETADKKLSDQREKIIKMNREIEELDKKKAALEETLKKYEALKPETGRKVFRHVVEKGETLRGLAEKYYGNAEQWTVIFDANRDKIKRGVLKTGDEIIIP